VTAAAADTAGVSQNGCQLVKSSLSDSIYLVEDVNVNPNSQSVPAVANNLIKIVIQDVDVGSTSALAAFDPTKTSKRKSVKRTAKPRPCSEACTSASQPGNEIFVTDDNHIAIEVCER
jgi:hypothetical protein